MTDDETIMFCILGLFNCALGVLCAIDGDGFMVGVNIMFASLAASAVWK